MAEFGVNATQLSGPQGAGTAPIAPVQEQAITVDWMKPLSDIGDIFAKGLKSNAKAEAEALKNGVISGYVREQQLLNDGVASGQIKPEVAASKSRAIYGKYAAGNPQYIEDLFKAKNALSGGSELGEVEDAAKAQKAMVKARQDAARSNGAIIDPSWMDEKTIEQQMVKAETGAAALQAFELKRKMRSDELQETAEQRTVTALRDKQDAVQMLDSVAGANLTSTAGVIRNIRENILSGKMTQEEGQLALEQSFSDITLTLNKAAGINPELVSSYRQLFDGMREIGRSALDPKADSKKLEDEINRIRNTEHLKALQSPDVRKIVGAIEVFGPNSITLLSSMPLVTKIVAQAATADSLTGAFVPQIVGNPEVEKDVLKFLKEAIPKLNTAEYKDNAKAEKETLTTVNNILKQTGDLMNDPTSKRDPAKFVEMAKFFASPEYGKFAASGKLNPEAAAAAKYTWQASYVPSVRGTVQTKLDEYLTTQAQSKAAPKMVSEAVTVVFSGSEISFAPKSKTKLDQVEARDQQEALRTLKSSEAAINQLIKIGAHLEGSQDYAGYWDKYKHVFMPQLFSKYKDLPLGFKDEASGKTYIGGDANAPTSWK